MKKKLGLDLDEVIYPLRQSYYDWYCRTYNLQDSYSKFWRETFWTFSDFFVDNTIYIPILYENHVPNKEIVDMLNRISIKYDIYYISARINSLYLTTLFWLRRYNFPQYNNIYLTTDKAIEISKLEIDYHVDDKHEELANYTELIVMRKDYNKDYCDKYLNINSILELEELLERMNL